MSDSAIGLRGLLDVAAAVRTGGELRSVLEAVAAAIAGPLGYGAVVLNLFRPAWDDFEVVVVLGNEESQELLMGQTSAMEDCLRSRRRSPAGAAPRRCSTRSAGACAKRWGSTRS